MSDEKKEEMKKPDIPKNDVLADAVKAAIAETPKDEKKVPTPEEIQKQIEELTKAVAEQKAKYETADKDAEEWKNKYYQAYADMANTRKQVEREASDFRKYAQQGFLEELIPALDSFDSVLKQEPGDSKYDAFREGLAMIHTKLLNVMKSMNVVIIDPKPGETYDASTMQAFSTVDGTEDNKVADTYLRGYQLYDHLLRPAGVIITRKPEVKPDMTEKKDAKKGDVAKEDMKTSDEKKDEKPANKKPEEKK
jgi:molecular chaperone GrpE